MVNCLMVQILRKTETGKKRSSFSKFCTAGHRLVGGWPVDPARKKVRKSSQLFRRLNQAQEQQRAGQTGRDGKRCAALLGLTRQCGTWECSLFTLEEHSLSRWARSQRSDALFGKRNYPMLTASALGSEALPPRPSA